MSKNNKLIFFAVALVLFEFSVYICNDMVQPAMLAVVQEFMVSSSWVPLSMTAFLLGGASLPWLTGPLSDRFGRRPVLLVGVGYFVVMCLATYLVSSIELFIILRFFQGIGLCFINAVGYAAIQEAFEEKLAVKVVALMGNVSLLAPLLGPLAGSTLIELAPWRLGFVLIAIIAFVSWCLLLKYMPETACRQNKPIKQIVSDYLNLFTYSPFVWLALCIPLLLLPMISWIALSPVILVKDFHTSPLQYALMQIPVFLGLLAGNFALAYLAGRWLLGRSVLFGLWPISFGLVCMLFGWLFSVDYPHYYLMIGMTFIALGQGLGFGVIYRFALMSYQKAGKGTVSAALSVVAMLGYALGIEITRVMYIYLGFGGYVMAVCVFTLIYMTLAYNAIRHTMRRRAIEGRRHNLA